uniref:Uncharacterized protein n=1 Tax=Nelumbo nucifera TaxID=4432 RepID=A0A822Z755_NELNU|nr:TPA_asm: hypothetical protein HUJ06_013814 [Nelumbo nucifera]
MVLKKLVDSSIVPKEWLSLSLSVGLFYSHQVSAEAQEVTFSSFFSGKESNNENLQEIIFPVVHAAAADERMNPRHNCPERGDQSDELFRIDPTAVERMNHYHDRPRGLNDDHFSISTELKLHEDPWVLKKTLTISDVDNLSRLMLKKALVQADVLPFMEGQQVEVNNGADTRVQIKDLDTGSEHKLTLRMWPGSRRFLYATAAATTPSNRQLLFSPVDRQSL